MLILSEWYTPANLAGGPIQSVHNIASHLSKAFHISIYTGAFDIGDNEVMNNVQTDAWVNKSAIKVYYQSLKNPGIDKLRNILISINPDLVYLNGMFSKHFVIDYLRLRVRDNIPCKVILTPHGMLKKSALEKKWLKKWMFLRFARFIGLYSDLKFHATNVEEQNEILSYFPNASVSVIANLPPPILAYPPIINKLDYQLKLCFVGRIHPIKNLLFLLNILQDVKCNISLSIAGYEEDKNYANSCHRLIKSLPPNIAVTFLGGLPHDTINDILAKHHLFILPTLGENYGHAIIEALSVGRPVLISDQTPWKNLENYNAGWELPLSDRQAWINAIGKAASWDQAEFDRHCQGALVYARAHTKVEELVEKYREMFGG